MHQPFRERRRAQAGRFPERTPAHHRQRRGGDSQLGRGARRRRAPRLRADRVLQLSRGLRRLRLRLLEPRRARLNPLQTTIAGSLPKPAWLAEPRKLWAPWLLEGDLLEEGKRDAMRLLLADQEAAGIDIVTDGEQTRRHFVTTFIESLKGVDFEHKRTVRIRNRYDADVPVVVAPVARGKPVFVEDVRFLRAQTKRPIKISLPGP